MIFKKCSLSLEDNLLSQNLVLIFTVNPFMQSLLHDQPCVEDNLTMKFYIIFIATPSFKDSHARQSQMLHLYSERAGFVCIQQSLLRLSASHNIIDIHMNPSSNLLRNSYGYQLPDPPTLRSPTSRPFPGPFPPQNDNIRQQEVKLQGMESLARKMYSQAELPFKGFPTQEPLTEQFLRGSCQTALRKFDYTALRNTTHFNPMAKFPTTHKEIRRSPGGEDPHRAGNKTLAQQPNNAFLRPNEKKLLENKHSFLANHHAKTPPKGLLEKQLEDKGSPPSRTPTKFKTLFDNSIKTSATLKQDQEKKFFKSLNEIAEIKQKEKLAVQASRSPLKRSKILNGFEMGGSLGKGKFGEVFLARHHDSGFIAALKRTEKKKIREFKMVDQFSKEIRLHSSLDHPNIVKFYGVFEEPEEVYLVLQYLNGGTLFDYLNEVTALPLREAVEYLRDVIEALAYLHDRSIAHRDIKPQNIVISSEGVAKLCDFGWSALVETSRKTYCGTFDYAPPEILERKNYDTSVDIWCVGVLTYELLTGRVPFEGDKRNVIMDKIVNVDRNSFEYPPEVPPEAREFIEALVQKDPAQRPKCHDLLKFRLFTQHLPKGGKPKKMQ